jgi:hypothetical protein
MKFLCLAYGDEDGWNSLSDSEKQEALAHDAVIRDRGNFVSPVTTNVISVRNWNRNLEVTEEAYAVRKLPLAGFSVIEANCLEDVIELVSNTPCARARGVIDIRPLQDSASNKET